MVMSYEGPFAREVEGLARSGGIFAEFLEKPSTSWAVRADGVRAALSLRGLQAMCRMSTVAQSFAEGGEAVIRGRGRGCHSPKGQGRHPRKGARPSFAEGGKAVIHQRSGRGRQTGRHASRHTRVRRCTLGT